MESGSTVLFALAHMNREPGDTDGEDLADMVFIASYGGLMGSFGQFAQKQGPKPASRASIEAMPKVLITEEDRDKECPVCLVDWDVGGEAREMPCKHKYHGGCIEKWLGVHGTCPICRYKMPVDEEEERRRASDGGDGEEGRTGFWVRIASFSGRRNPTSSDNQGE